MSYNRVPALAQFNKLNKKFIMILGPVDDISMLNHDFYLYREIEIDQDREIVIGNYDNYNVIDEQDAPLRMTEDSLNALARDKIYEKYPLENQLSMIENMLETIADKVDIDCEDLKEMNDFINEVRRVNGIRKQYFANSQEYEYKSTEELNEALANKYEGGIHEFGTGVHDF